MSEVIAKINDGKAVIFHVIGEDCTFSHYRVHKIIKGYIELSDDKGKEEQEE